MAQIGPDTRMDEVRATPMRLRRRNIWIDSRWLKSGTEKFDLFWLPSGAKTPQRLATFFTRAEAQAAASNAKAQLRQHKNSRPILSNLRGATLVEYVGSRVGRSYRLRYREPGGHQVVVTLGTERDGYTRKDAERARDRFIYEGIIEYRHGAGYVEAVMPWSPQHPERTTSV